MDYTTGITVSAELRCLCGCLSLKQFSRLMRLAHDHPVAELEVLYKEVCTPTTCGTGTPVPGGGDPIVPIPPNKDESCPECGGPGGGSTVPPIPNNGVPPTDDTTSDKVKSELCKPSFRTILKTACNFAGDYSSACEGAIAALDLYCTTGDKSQLPAICDVVNKLVKNVPIMFKPALIGPMIAAAAACGGMSTPAVIKENLKQSFVDTGKSPADVLSSVLSGDQGQDILAQLGALVLPASPEVDPAGALLAAVLASAQYSETTGPLYAALDAIGLTVGAGGPIIPDNGVVLSEKEVAQIAAAMTDWALSYQSGG